MKMCIEKHHRRGPVSISLNSFCGISNFTLNREEADGITSLICFSLPKRTFSFHWQLCWGWKVKRNRLISSTGQADSPSWKKKYHSSGVISFYIHQRRRCSDFWSHSTNRTPVLTVASVERQQTLVPIYWSLSKKEKPQTALSRKSKWFSLNGR